MEQVERRARELIEQRRTLEAQVWLAGITAIVERRRRQRLALGRRQGERIASLVETIGDDDSAKHLGELLTSAATLQPDVTSELLDVVERVLHEPFSVPGA